MAFFWEWLSYLGGSVALVAAAAYLARQLTQHRLDKDIEDFKAQLGRDTAMAQVALQRDIDSHKAALSHASAQALDQARFEFDKELLARRGEIDFMRDAVKYANESDQQRKARLHAQIQRWANPIRNAINDLDHRLGNILGDGAYQALSPRWKAPPQWSADHDYFMTSTMYYFAQYFCWVRMMQLEIGYELFRSTGEMQEFADEIEKVADHLSRYPYRVAGTAQAESSGALTAVPGGPASAAAKDRQVFRLQQRAIGELLLGSPETGRPLLSYKDFVDNWSNHDNPQWNRHLAPLQAFLLDIGPEDDTRWARLQAMREELGNLRDMCNRVLGRT
jgi:hypothetical protein